MLFRMAGDGTYLNFIPGVAAEPLVQPSQFIGKKVRDILPGELAEEIMRAIERVLESGHTQSWEYQLAQDGEPRHFEARISRCAEDEVLAAVRDITERKRAEEALREAREALEGRVERQLLRRNVYGLTFREFTVLHLVAAGKADKEIAYELGISPLTVHKHVANILGKMNAASRTEAAARALREGLLD